jgi:uncharacterized protein YndB with AHSA1/START domain
VYLDTVPSRRIVFACAMLVGDYRMSASMATVELTAADGGTHLLFTEQAAFFERSDGAKLRNDGCQGLFAQLEKTLSARQTGASIAPFGDYAQRSSAGAPGVNVSTTS